MAHQAARRSKVGPPPPAARASLQRRDVLSPTSLFIDGRTLHYCQCIVAYSVQQRSSSCMRSLAQQRRARATTLPLRSPLHFLTPGRPAAFYSAVGRALLAGSLQYCRGGRCVSAVGLNGACVARLRRRASRQAWSTAPHRHQTEQFSFTLPPRGTSPGWQRGRRAAGPRGTRGRPPGGGRAGGSEGHEEE